MNKKYRYGEEQTCSACGNRFTPRDKGTKQTTCSYKCRGVLQTRAAIRTCAICGKSFLPSRPGYKTCGRKCGVILRSSMRKRDPMVSVRNRLALFCCSSIARCLRNKTDRTYKMLGYTPEDLRKHLEKHMEDGMSWDNYGKGMTEWSIDHTRPISSFPITTLLSEINALDNIRPMWHRKNCSKKNKWEGL